jgi:hypothetical protein
MEALPGSGVTVQFAEILPQSSTPYFSVPAARLLVNGASVQVYEYATVSDADADAARISKDGGSIATTLIHWISTPHFFRGNRIIVLYVGTDAELLRALQGLLGPQFAGR